MDRVVARRTRRALGSSYEHGSGYYYDRVRIPGRELGSVPVLTLGVTAVELLRTMVSSASKTSSAFETVTSVDPLIARTPMLIRYPKPFKRKMATKMVSPPPISSARFGVLTLSVRSGGSSSSHASSVTWFNVSVSVSRSTCVKPTTQRPSLSRGSATSSCPAP